MNVQLTFFRAALAAVAVSVLVACRDVDSPGVLVTRTQNSTEVPIVENARPVDGSRLGWRIGPRPVVSIGKQYGDEAYLLFYATDATRLSDGRLVVLNYSSAELRVFDGEGIHMDTWGGRGDGPGEFSIPVSQIARLPGDSVIVWNPQFPSMSVFDPTGNPERKVQVLQGREPRADPILPVAVLRDGSILAGPDLGFETGDSVVVELRDATGAFKSSLGTHLGLERHLDYQSRTIYRAIFGRSLVMEPWGELVVVTPTDRYELQVFAQDGSLARVVRRDHVLRTPSAAHVEGFIEARASRLVDEEAREQRRRGYESVPVAEHLPAFGSVIADALDHLWVEEFVPPGEERQGVLWSVFDPDGRILGFVETPEELEVYEIGADYILGQVEDELGVESILVWPLERVEG